MRYQLSCANMVESNPELISVDSRPIRDIGNAIGQSLDRGALRELGLVDDDGDLVDDLEARQKIRSDGVVEIQLPIADD